MSLVRWVWPAAAHHLQARCAATTPSSRAVHQRPSAEGWLSSPARGANASPGHINRRGGGAEPLASTRCQPHARLRRWNAPPPLRWSEHCTLHPPATQCRSCYLRRRATAACGSGCACEWLPLTTRAHHTGDWADPQLTPADGSSAYCQCAQPTTYGWVAKADVKAVHMAARCVWSTHGLSALAPFVLGMLLSAERAAAVTRSADCRPTAMRQQQVTIAVTHR